MKGILSALKNRLKEWKTSNIRLLRGVYFIFYKGWRITKVIYRSVTSSEYRALLDMRVFHANRVQQTTQLTWVNRYPEIFQACKEYCDRNHLKDIRILSYGCCTGEEVITLRRYFPEAVIVGAEINRNSLRICRARKCDHKIHFVKSTPRNIRKYAPFDLVFCMAVLQRTPHFVENNGITDIGNMYPFEKYHKQVKELDTYVKEGGMLVLHHTQYDLLDTDLKDCYQEYGNWGFEGLLFGEDSRLKREKGFRKSIYLKNNNV